MKQTLLSITVAVVALPLCAKVYYAAPNGDDSAPENSETTPWTLQKCLTSQATEVRVLKGHYYLESELHPWAGQLIIGWKATREEVILDGQNKCRVFSTDNNVFKNNHLENLTFVNGNGVGTTGSGTGGGLYLNAGGCTMTNCVVMNCTAATKGGGVAIQQQGHEFVDCLFVGNSAPASGHVNGGAVFRRCTFVNGDATGSVGGAVEPSAPAELSDCVFSNMTAVTYGGAVYGLGDIRCLGCRFYNCRAGQAGGAVYGGNGPLTLVDCYCTNCVGAITTVMHGGAVVANNSVLSLTNCTFLSCAGCDGGALALGRNSTAAAHLTQLSVVDCTFDGCYQLTAYPSSCQGGAMHLENVESGLIDRCVFRNCWSTNSYAGLYLKNANTYPMNGFEIRNSLFERNRSGGSYNKSGSSYPCVAASFTNFFVKSCTFVENTSGGTFPAVSLYCADAVGIVRNCLFYHNLSDTGSQYDDVNGINDLQRGLYTNCFIYAGSVTVNGCFGKDQDPKFADEAGKDYRLTKGSPCVNTGFNEPWMTGTKDLQNAKRVQRIEQDVVDVGCYEYRPTPGLQLLVR